MANGNGNGHRSKKILKGADAISEYAGIGRSQLFELLKKGGFPAYRLFGGSVWYAHADNVDEYFRRITLVTRHPNINLEDDETGGLT